MRLFLTLQIFQQIPMEVDGDMEIENLKALIEVEVGVPIHQQELVLNKKILSDPKKTLRQSGIAEGAFLFLRTSAKGPAQQQPFSLAPQGQGLADSKAIKFEQIRQQILSSPQLQGQLHQNNPALLEAARDKNPRKFYEVFEEFENKRAKLEEEKRREMERLEADPFDVEAQKKIEEIIRQENVNSNMELAIEEVPEAFGRVFMLYINGEVNGVKTKAFVDSGAQMTIMSLAFAERCGLARLMDKRWTGVAKGVGSAKIVGRIHMAQLKIEDTFFPCSFTILENQPMELLFGLDMLRRHQCIIDLARNVLRVGSIETRFLHENEIPKTFDDPEPSSPGPAPAITTPFPATAPTSTPKPAAPVASPQPQPARPAQPQVQPQPQVPAQQKYPEEHIQALMSFGITRQQAIEALHAAGGNPDVAAGFLFP